MELPEIEPAPKGLVSCRNVEFDYAKRRERRGMICGYARGVDGVNTPRGPSGLPVSDHAVSDGHVAMVVGKGVMIEPIHRLQMRRSQWMVRR